MKSSRLLIGIVLVHMLLYGGRASGGSQPPPAGQSGSSPIAITEAPYNCDNTGQADCAPGLELLQQHLGRQGTIHLPPGTFAIKKNLTIAAGMVLQVKNGGLLKVWPGATLTLETSSIEAGNYQIFGGAGKIVFSGGQHLKTGWFADFAAAVDQIGASRVELTITRSETIPANIAIFPGTTLVFGGAGHMMTLADGAVLAINGPLQAGLSQIFAISGTGKVRLGPGSVAQAYPQWWGAAGDGVVASKEGTDNTAAINAACAAYPVVHLVKGVYKTGTPGIRLVGDQVFSGDGPEETIIFANRANGTESFNVLTNLNYLNHSPIHQRLTVRGLSLYAYGQDLTDVGISQNNAGNCAAFDYVNGLVFESVNIYDAALNGVFIGDTTDFLVRNVVGKNLGRVSYTNMTDPNWQVKASANGITIQGSTPLAALNGVVENCSIDTCRDVFFNAWQTDNVVFRDCTANGSAYPGVTSLNGVAVGFSSEGGNGSSANARFINCNHLNSLVGFYIGGADNILDNPYVQGAASGPFTAGIKVSADNCTINNYRLRTQGTNYPTYGIVATLDDPARYVSGLKINGGDIQNAQNGIYGQNLKNFEFNRLQIDCNYITDSSGILVNIYPGGAPNYDASSIIRQPLIKMAANAGIYLLNVDGITVEDSNVLGASSAYRIFGCKVYLQRCACRKYDNTHLIGFSVYFENNSSGCRILDCNFADYNNSSGNYPYGMYLATTGLAAYVRYDATAVTEETVNGKLKALAGSQIKTQPAGDAVWLWQNTDGGSKWSRE
jgi:hypothetical protein